MTQQFTASEVRGQIAWLRNVTVVGTKTTCQMLDAFADMLEAREKSVPVAWVNDLLTENEKAKAELAEAQNTIAAQQGTMGALKRKLALAEGELAALKAAIAGSARVEVTLGCAIDGEIPPDLALCKVALVKVEK